MKENFKVKKYIVLLGFFVISICVQASIKLDISNKIDLKTDKAYPSCVETLYVIQDNVLYEIDNKNISVIFINNNGITGIVFNCSRLVIFNDTEIFVFNVVSRALMWKKKFKGRIVAEPFLTLTNLFVDRSAHVLMSLDIDTGKCIWKFNMSFEQNSLFTNAKFLITPDYIIYIHANRKIIVLLKDSGIQMHVYNIEIFDIDKFKNNSNIITAEIYNEIIYVMYDSGNFFAFDIGLGACIFSEYDDKYVDFLLYFDRIVFLKTIGNIISYNKFTGEEVWKKTVFSDHCYAPIFLDKKELLLVYNKNGFINFLDVKDGSSVYTNKFNMHIEKIIVSISEKKMWIFTFNGRIIFLNIRGL